MSEFSDYSRKELEAQCRYLEALVEEQGSVINDFNELMQYVEEVAETDSGGGSADTLRWRVKMLKRRNKKLKEENSELKARAESAEGKARAVALEEVLKRQHTLKLLQECRRKLACERNRRTEEVEGTARTDAHQFAKAVAQARKNGTSWGSGADLLRWLDEWAEEHKLGIPHSPSTIKRRFQEAGLWAGSGRRGRASVEATVERCIAFQKNSTHKNSTPQTSE